MPLAKSIVSSSYAFKITRLPRKKPHQPSEIDTSKT